MTRWWNETFDSLTDLMSVPLLALVSFVVTLLIALAWYFWPDWLPSNWRVREGASRGDHGRRRDRRPRQGRFRLGRLRWRLRWRRRRKEQAEEEPSATLLPDELPDLPAAVLALTADDLAAAGRYAEAVRERLRAIVRDLIERGLIPPSPGWTVTEIARQAGLTLPSLAAPLDGAVEVFSRIWYGQLPATNADDAAMRGFAGAIAGVLAQPLAGSAR